MLDATKATPGREQEEFSVLRCFCMWLAGRSSRIGKLLHGDAVLLEQHRIGPAAPDGRLLEEGIDRLVVIGIIGDGSVFLDALADTFPIGFAFEA